MLKWLFSLLPGEAKDLVAVKKLLAREGDWECIKEILGWILDTESGTVVLPELNIQELIDLLEIPTSQRRMGGKDLERLVGKLFSIYLAVLGAISHIYHLQRALAQAGADRAWMYPEFHRGIADWSTLVDYTSAGPTHLDEIVRRKPTHMGFCNTSGLGVVGVWLDPSLLGKYLVWHHPWLADIITNRVSSIKREGAITNSNIKLAAPVLREATLIAAVPDARMAAPYSGSDNTLTVS